MPDNEKDNRQEFFIQPVPFMYKVGTGSHAGKRRSRIEDIITRTSSHPPQTAEALLRAALDGNNGHDASVVVVSVVGV